LGYLSVLLPFVDVENLELNPTVGTPDKVIVFLSAFMLL